MSQKEASKNPLGWNDYDKIRDSTGVIDIEPYAFDRIESYKDPLAKW
jgi:hypothetical protein